MKILLAVLLIVLSVTVYSQNDSIYKFTLPELKITQLEKGKDIIYEFTEDRNIFILNESTIKADPVKYKYSLLILDFKSISIVDGNNGWRSAKVMGLAGGGLGLITGIIFSAGFEIQGSNLSTFLPLMVLSGMLAGGLLGGIIGAAVPYYENYTSFHNELAIKQKQIEKIFIKHQIKNK
jgi:hypothetical protein